MNIDKLSEKHIDWDTYFMGVAYLSALRSKDPSTQVGACIINNEKRIVGIGYNGFPYGCDDDEFPWEKNGSMYDSKYAYVVHAELNAILNSNADLHGSIIYVTHFPCNECAKAIIQSGIKTVIHASTKNMENEGVKASKRMFKAAGINISKVNELAILIEKSANK